MEKKKNVLLLCLSMTKLKGGSDGIYSYICNGKEKPELVEGYLTNEAPAKSIIHKLNEAGERLDEIIVICSESVRNPVIKNGDRSTVDDTYMLRKEKVLEQDKDSFMGMNHIELYESLIHRFSREINKDYEEHPIVFYKIPISDDADGAGVAEAAVEAARYLEVQDEDVENPIDLYIDYNGGQRYMAFMIVAIANLAKVRGVEVKEILTMNYEQKQNDIVPIQNMRGVFGCIDLVAGVREYINYGRIKMLETYFKNSHDERILGILDDMKKFSYAMQLCDSSYVFAHRDELRKKLGSYKDDIDHKDRKNTYETLFLYVVTDILNGYQTLFEGNRPEIVEWCIEKDFIQQALTFYAEQMPTYFWESGIYSPTEIERREYKAFYEFCKNKKKREYCVYNDKYCWLVKFLCHSHEYENEKKEYGYKEGTLIKIELSAKDIPSVVGKGEPFEKERKNVSDITKKVMGALDVGRAKSSLEKTPSRLALILNDYFFAKKLRNTFNHADDERSENIQYEDVCEFVKKAMYNLRKFTEEAAK